MKKRGILGGLPINRWNGNNNSNNDQNPDTGIISLQESVLPPSLPPAVFPLQAPTDWLIPKQVDLGRLRQGMIFLWYILSFAWIANMSFALTEVIFLWRGGGGNFA